MAVTLAGGVFAVARASQEAPGAQEAPAPVPTAAPWPRAPDTLPTAVPTTKVPGPPTDTVHTEERYRARYQATYAGWDDLLADGRPLPEVSAGCRSAWSRTTRDEQLDWDKAGYLCLNQLAGRGFKPQGVGGSGTVRSYRIGDGAARDRNLVIISAYSAKSQPGLVFPHRVGETDTTRLTVIDLDQRRYNTIELVKPTGAGTFTALDSHGSGLVWVGQYLYSSSRTALWMYNADDLMRIGGRYVLPAVARWSVRGEGGGLSSLGISRSGGSTVLTSINYSQTGRAWSQTFPLDAQGRLQRTSTAAAHDLVLTSSFGPGPASLRSRGTAAVPGTNFQGIGRSGHYRIANSSSLMLDGRRHGDNVVIMKKSAMLARFTMPEENIESLYLDEHRGRYVTITEHGKQFLFWLPLDHLIQQALNQRTER